MEEENPDNPSDSSVAINATLETHKSNEEQIKNPSEATVSLDLSSESSKKSNQDSLETATIDSSSTKTETQIVDTKSTDLPVQSNITNKSDSETTSDSKTVSNDKDHKISDNSKSECDKTEDNTAEKKEENVGSEYDPKNVHYEGDVAIYTDPKSGYQYKWNNETNEWLPKGGVTYGYEDDTHTYTDTDGVKYFWDVEKNAWFPKIDDDFMARYQMSYGFVNNKTEEKESEEKKVVAEEVIKVEPKKEKVAGVKRKPEVTPPTWFEVNDQQNTKVYVSNLPTDITEEEFVDLMQKYGLVMRDLQTGKMKVKLYTVPETDILKGDALCTYIKIESVELALKLLDGYLYRGKRLKVERAKFQMKGEYNPGLKPKKKKRKEKDKLKKMQEKLFDWRPEKLRGERSKHERVVIVKNLFEPSLFDKDVSLILEYQQDLREECGKSGEVKRVVLYDRHPEGVAQITMKEPEEADEVVVLLNGRWFGQRKLTAEIWDGKTKFKIAETDAQISKRIDNWEKFLEEEDAERKAEEEKKKTETKTETE